ncbi:unnamed protein product (mitochondrion) [Plasmodiophora brassicae]|uniref:Carboxypeptidase n=1 Tax=Plasmodiophora brassicae TaxID=37360 RepID=A0A0G4J1S2_PLABS|nr:hypothetical protein PBRA_001827 [Plasmodiophora brassicae]SPR01261.1 unnamed protein product [Plasmodiophora brassicae]
MTAPVTMFVGAAVVAGVLAGLCSAGSWGPERVQQHTGYVTVNTQSDNGGHIFYWMFESRADPTNDPLILWMTGGPGCSSELAVFYEQGPYRLDANGTVSINPHSWNGVANVLFVDQPAGTGFSYCDNDDDYVVSEAQVGEDMFEFLQGFFDRYPQYAKLPLFVTGESYAGHYVPAVANRIFNGNKAAEGRHVNLAGAAIGNGMVNAKIQYLEYVTFVKKNHMIKSKSKLARVERETSLCKYFMDHGLPGATAVCNSIIVSIQQYAGNFNVYDIREECSHGSLCYDFSALDDLMGDPKVQDALDVSPLSTWSECSTKVYQHLSSDWFLECDHMLVPLLESKIPVLVYSGTKDFICNYIGGMAWVSALKWSRQEDYNRKQFQDWNVFGKKAGEFKTAGPLTFLKVFDAGHMVPMNQPGNSLAMISSFISGASYGGPHSLLTNSEPVAVE